MRETAFEAQRDRNRKALAEYLILLPKQFSAYHGINPFWQDITSSFRSSFVPPQDVEAANNSADEILAAIHTMPKTSYLVRPIDPDEFVAAWEQIVADMAAPNSLLDNKARYEAAIAASFLAHSGLLSEAHRTMRALRIEPKYVTLRHFFYFSQLRGALSGNEPLDVLEIGAGGSTLKLYLKHCFKNRIRSYCIIDLPEMLCLAAKASMDFFPDEAITFCTDDRGTLPHTSANAFIPAHRANLISAPGRFNVFINTHSFQEMDPTIIQSYFDLIYGTARKGSIFFQTNLVQNSMTRLDGKRFKNNPAKYPFRPTDQILLNAQDPFHVYARERFKYKPGTKALTSIRQITPGDYRPSTLRRLSNFAHRYFKANWRR